MLPRQPKSIQMPTKLGPAKSKKNGIDLVICTTAGVLCPIEITKEVEASLEQNKAVKSYFLGGIMITSYIISPAFQSGLMIRHGEIKGNDIVNRLKLYLNSIISKSVIEKEKNSINSLCLE